MNIIIFQNGAVHCDKVTCPRPECEHPYTPEGKCCPVCVGRDYTAGLHINKINTEKVDTVSVFFFKL